MQNALSCRASHRPLGLRRAGAVSLRREGVIEKRGFIYTGTLEGPREPPFLRTLPAVAPGGGGCGGCPAAGTCSGPWNCPRSPPSATHTRKTPS